MMANILTIDGKARDKLLYQIPNETAFHTTVLLHWMRALLILFYQNIIIISKLMNYG